MQPFAREASAALYFVQGISANTLTAGSTINTYSVAPQPAAGIDSWNSGRILPRKLLVLINVGTVSGTGTLTVTLRDDDAAITTANGDANTGLVATLATIAASGLYYAEINLNHIFPNNTEATNYIKRYHSIRAVAASADFTFSIDCVYASIDKLKPTQTATVKAITYND